MANRNPQQGLIGLPVVLTLVDQDGAAIDISTATVKKIVFQKPNGAVVEKTAIFDSNGTDGKIKYVTVADDLDQAGIWHLQANVTTPTLQGKSSVVPMRVVKNLT